MTKNNKKNIDNEDIIDDIENEIDKIEQEEEPELEQGIEPELIPEDEKCIDRLARTMADFDNFKKRTDRDKQDMIFYIKSDIFKKILPRFDDLDRIIKNTKEENKDTPIYEGAITMQKSILADLDKLGVKSFDSIGEEVNPDFHDVMTTLAGAEEGIIVDEFEKGYMLGDRVLRHAKVVAGAGE